MHFSVSEAFCEEIDAPQSVPELPAASRNRNTKKALFGYDLVIGVLVTGLQPLEAQSRWCFTLGSVMVDGSTTQT